MKEAVFIGSSLDDLAEMPEAVQDAFGYALHLVQNRRDASQCEVVEAPAGCMGTAGRLQYRYLSRRVCGEVSGSDLYFALLSEEIEERHRDSQSDKFIIESRLKWLLAQKRK